MKRKSSGKHSKPKQSKTTLITSAIIIFICVAGIVIYLNKILDNEHKEIEKIVNSAFSALKSANKEEVNKYIDYNQIVSSLDEMILQESEVTNLEKELFKSMQWTVKSINIQKNKVEVTIEMKNKDFKNILTIWMKEIVNKKAKNEVISNEFSLKSLENIILQNDTTKVVTKNILLEEQNGNWKFIVNDNLRDLIFTGIESVATAINEKK